MQVFATIIPIFAVAIKIIALPLVGLVLFMSFGVETAELLPGLILLATPTATVAYVMAQEMEGDEAFVAAAISVSTLASAVTYIAWLLAVGTTAS
jgi:predicted permease